MKTLDLVTIGFGPRRGGARTPPSGAATMTTTRVGPGRARRVAAPGDPEEAIHTLAVLDAAPESAAMGPSVEVTPAPA